MAKIYSTQASPLPQMETEEANLTKLLTKTGTAAEFNCDLREIIKVDLTNIGFSSAWRMSYRKKPNQTKEK